MKISKEIKVGILGIVGIAIFYFGFTFLKGLDVFSNSEEYHVKFIDVQGLETSNPVTYNGVNVGRVIGLKPDFESNSVDVILSINKKVKVTENTVAVLADDGLIGGKIIKLLIKPGNPLSPNGFLKSNTEISLMASVEDKLTPTLRNMDSLMVSLTRIVNDFDNTGEALKVLMASATQTTVGVNGLLANNSKNLGQITSNAAVLTQNLNTLTKSLDKQLQPILTKTGSFTDSLSQLQLGQTVKSLNSTIAGLEGILKDVNAGNGTLGKLTNDDSLYVNLDNTAASLNKLLEDMKNNPKRYVHFSLFGRKEKNKE